MIANILNIAWKELLHLWRDRIMLPFFILGALLELILIGWATGQPIDDLSMTVLDQDQSAESQALLQQLDETATLKQDHRAQNESDINRLMNRNETVIGVIIPAGYGDALISQQQPQIDLILNGAESVSAQEAERTAQSVIYEQGMRDAYGLEPSQYIAFEPQVTLKYNEKLHRSWYSLPSEMGFMFYVMTIAIAALGITRERERGTYEQLQVMPFRPIEVILGKSLAPMMVGYGLFLAMIGVVTIGFGVPIRGSLVLLLGLGLIYLMAELGKGLLLSLLGRTQLQAVLLVFSMAMVDLVFSGYAVPVENMPPAIRTVSNVFAIRHWLIIMRGIMLKNVGVTVLYPHILAIIGIGMVIISFTALRYRRTSL